jgi:predicted nuclease of predicted toxin-antitoxin system
MRLAISFLGRFMSPRSAWPPAQPTALIWDYARNHGFAIITADTDFVTMANTYGPPPKIIPLENCDYPNSVALHIITANAILLSQFERDSRALLILQR